MSNPNAFPGYISTTTTTSMGTTTVKVEPLLWFDSSYIHTRPGQLQIAAVALDLIAFICSTMGSCTTCGSVTFFNLIAIVGFWTSLSLLALYLFHVIEKIERVNWPLSEFIFTGIWCVFFLVSSLILLTNGGVYAAASVSYLASIHWLTANWPCKYFVSSFSVSSQVPFTVTTLSWSITHINLANWLRLHRMRVARISLLLTPYPKIVKKLTSKLF